MLIRLEDLISDIEEDLAAAGNSVFPTATENATYRGKMVVDGASKTQNLAQYWAYYDVIPSIRAACELHRAGVMRADYAIGRRETPIEECEMIPEGEKANIPTELTQFLTKFGEDAGSIDAVIADIAAKQWVVGVGYYALIDENGLAGNEGDVSGVKRSDDDTRRLFVDETTRWLTLSDQEITRVMSADSKSFKWMLTDYLSRDGTCKTRYIGDADIIVIELPKRHPRSRRIYDTSLRPLAGDCEALLALLRTVRVIANSQAASGILMLPQSATTPRVRDSESGEQRGGTSPTKALIDGITAPLKDERAVGALIPVLLTSSNAESLAQVRWIDLRRAFDKSISDLIDKYDRRIREGLDQQTDEVAGTADQNHWSAMQSANNQKDRYAGRAASEIAALITRGILRPFLRAMRVKDDWAWGLIVDESAIDSAQREWLVLRLAELGVLSAAATLRELGFDPDDASNTIDVQTDNASDAPVSAPDKPEGLAALGEYRGLGEAARLHLGARLRSSLGVIAGDADIGDLPLSAVVDAAASQDLITITELEETENLLREDFLAAIGEELPAHYVEAMADELLAVWRGNVLCQSPQG